MNKVKTSWDDILTSGVSYLFIAFFALLCLIPFFLVLGSSFTDEVTLVKEGYNIWPRKFSLGAYRLALNANDIGSAYRVTLFITAVGTFLSMLFTSAIAYALSVKSFRIRNNIAFFLYFTMLFNGGLVATYLLVSKYLNMKNNIWVLIIPGMLNAYNILIMRNFFSGIPDSLAESARLDGANEISILFRIIIPVSTPGIATISLFYALGYWNEWYKVLLYISDSKLFTLQYLIMRILRQVNYASTLPSDVIFNAGALPAYSFRMAAIVMAIGPIVLLYPFLQKYFVSGLTVGSVKG
ncbi:MAG: carbohydrate ABC transporter permease [Treponema sp.]|jgi:multiple sugar transport system permease protein/putative aldouronate transport system permease protein|nr:carbohydrate ABC transporter permease [Treponema sp.]